MDEIIFKIIFVLLWIVYILIRAPFEKRYKQIEKSKPVNPAVERSLLLLLGVGLTIVPLLWLVTPFLDSFHIELPVWVRLAGVVIAVLSLFYFRWVHKTLGANWSPTLEIREGHELIKAGPYKRIRHPMYTQIWLWTIAMSLIISNWVAGFAGILAWAILYLVRVPREEAMMKEKFGDAYARYMDETGRVLPKL